MREDSANGPLVPASTIQRSVFAARACRRVVDQTPVHTGDHDDDPEQQAQAERGQQEAQKIVLYVAIGEVHGCCTEAVLAARPTRRPPVSRVTGMLFSASPRVIW